MTMLHRFGPLAGALLALAIAGCSTGPQAELGSTAAAATAPAEIEAIAQLLDRGDTKAARKRLAAALKRDPLNPSLLVLEQGMIGDARADLGANSYPYMVSPGDTMPALAERFLGNRLKAYQLARYNGLDNPAAIAPGQVLRIPGEAAAPAAEKRAQPRKPVRDKPRAIAAPAPSKPAPAAAPARVADKAGAQRARTAGLAALNKGDVAGAVVLLQRASALDPGNAAIAGDLARARRISATVRAKR